MSSQIPTPRLASTKTSKQALAQFSLVLGVFFPNDHTQSMIILTTGISRIRKEKSHCPMLTVRLLSYLELPVYAIIFLHFYFLSQISNFLAITPNKLA